VFAIENSPFFAQMQSNKFENYFPYNTKRVWGETFERSLRRVEAKFLAPTRAPHSVGCVHITAKNERVGI